MFDAPRMPCTGGLLGSVVDLATRPLSLLQAIGGRPPSLAEMPSGCRFHPRCPRRGERCAAEAPPLAPPREEHRWACWSPLG